MSLQASFAVGAALTFEKDIRPILKTHCFQCHGEDGVTKAGLDVRLRRSLEKGGESGPAIQVGKPHESLLLQMVSEGKMPKGKGKLTDKEIETLDRWISAGALTARPEPEKWTADMAFTEEDRQWWAYQPIQHPSVPKVASNSSTNPIDAFLSAKLTERGLSYSSPADRTTLIRRASYDLLGLPPSPAEVEAFVNDASPLAYEHLIDRLLASPHYGERWGRHWLDVSGYADSDGYAEKDLVREWAWRYRDYVIRSLNDDKPFDQFVREQLAGDEMVPQPHKNLNEAAIEKLTATGFLRMAPDGTGAMNDITARNSAMADTLKIVSGSLMGLTVGCAQCHDHRYDPITQADYYRMRAIFQPAFGWDTWRTPNARLISLLTDAQVVESDKIEAEAKKVDAVRLEKTEQYISEVLDKEIAKREPSIQAALRTAYRTEVKKRTPEQIKLLKGNPSVEKLSGGSLYLYDTTYKTKHADELKTYVTAATEIRAKMPKRQFVQALDELPAPTIPATYVFHRGQPDQPKEVVTPGDLSILSKTHPVSLPEKMANMPTSGRRTAFARELTDGQHPLLARVLVNRTWMHHFGKGIVTSVGDFGHLGQMPSHPELLDWLATEFMSQGWSMKKLHRLIMTSEAYQQVSTRDAAKERIDPDNTLLGRMNVRRLEAEALRDAMLSVSGRMSSKLYGAPVPVMLNEEGQAVLGIDTTDTAGRPTGKIVPLNGDEFRRSVYVQVRRSRPMGMLETFDAPSMIEPMCTERPSTTVSPQSLLLMNNGYMREFAEYFAQRLQAESAGDIPAQVAAAFRLSYGRAATVKDLEQAVAFVKEQTAFYKTHPSPMEYAVGPVSKTNADPALMGLAAFCHALLSSNEFLYVD